MTIKELKEKRKTHVICCETLEEWQRVGEYLYENNLCEIIPLDDHWDNDDHCINIEKPGSYWHSSKSWYLSQGKKIISSTEIGNERLLPEYPKEVKKLMLQRQEEDGNPRNLSVFTKDIYSGTGDGGFAWARTPEGADFWEKVLVHQNFDLFFEKYPKEVDDVPETKFKKGDRVTFVGEPEFAGSAKGSYHYITIPDRLITHGPTMIDYEYPIIIEDIYEEYYIVSFINNETGNATQLGFKEEALEFYVEEEKTKLQTLQSIRLGSTNQPRYEEVVEAPWEESCKDTIKKDNNFKRLKTKFF